MSHIFISYSHQDSDYARKLEGELKRRGFDVWIDDRIDYGTRWPQVIQEGLGVSSAVIVLMTPRSYNSEWVQNELAYAKELGKPVFPLLLEGDRWLSVAATQSVDVRNGKADRLPDLYRAWSRFLADGYDTIGEDWAHGTHVHAWSCTPNKDMVFYTLGVTPAEPGYGAVRVAPRLGSLAWAEGRIPTPHGPVSVRATAEAITVDSPVPVVIDLEEQAPRRLPAGQHEVSV